MSDRWYDDEMNAEWTGFIPHWKQPDPKLSVTGSQALIDWLECKDLKKTATDYTPEYPK